MDWRSLDDAKYIDETEIEIIESDEPVYYKDGETGTKIIISELNAPLEAKDIRSLFRNVL